jgi:hypothetical protein
MESIICETCKEQKSEADFHCRGLRAAPALCKKCFNKAALEYQRSWNKMPGAKERRKGYNQNPKSKEARTAWAQSKKGVEYMKIYSQKPEIKEYHKKYKQKPEVKMKDKEYKQKPEVKEMRRISSGKPKRKEYQKNYMKKPEVKERLNGYQRQRSRDVGDTYAKDLIYKKINGVLKHSEIPPELVELQRQSIILKRTIKQKQQENGQRNTTNL